MTIEGQDQGRNSALDALGLGQLRGQGAAFKVAVAGLLIAFFACFLPWVTESGFGLNQVGFSMFEGRWILAAIAIAGYLIYRYAHGYEPILLVGAGVASLVVLLGSLGLFVSAEFFNDSPYGVDPPGDQGRQTSYGLWVCVIGGALAVGGIAAMMRDLVSPPSRRSEAETRQVESDESPLPPPD